jgi:hypothetical protein
MKVISNFLNAEEFDKFSELILDCNDVQPGITNNEDDAIKGLSQTTFTNPSMEFSVWWISVLKNKGIIKDTVKIGKDLDLNIVEAHSPYYADWHKDSYKNITLGIILFYFSDSWDLHDGGLFLTKEDDSNYGTFVIPNANVLVVNPSDMLHAVTKITNGDKKRKSIVLFLKQEYFL